LDAADGERVVTAEAARSGRSRPTRRRAEGDQDARRRVIDAAIDCILEQGFYRASSNAIAERAGLTWGVIQYYFGSREALMLAVLEEGTHRLVEALSSAEITAPTLRGRLEEYTAVVERYYADPTYLAFVQVLLNLSHDPRTSRQTLETMMSIAKAVDTELERLTASVFGEMTIDTRELRGLVFYVLRGLALSEVMLETLPFDPQGEAPDFARQRRLLAEALAMLIEREAKAGRRRGRQRPVR
jgi:AcrR family transcriptional regulator